MYIFQVRASSILVPELCDLSDEGDDKYWFAYSIRLSLSPDGCMLDGVHHNSCQLYSRHWIIRAQENVVSDVRGEAVIGKVLHLYYSPEFIRLINSYAVFHQFHRFRSSFIKIMKNFKVLQKIAVISIGVHQLSRSSCKK